MTKIIQTPTLLQRRDIDGVEILNEKASTGANVADYIGWITDGCDSDIDRANHAIKELKAFIDSKKEEKQYALQTAYKWLDSNGIDKEKGMIVSSMTIFKPKAKEELIIHDDDYFLSKPEFTKTVLDKTAIKNYLLFSEIDMSEIAEIVTTQQQPTAKINRRKS